MSAGCWMRRKAEQSSIEVTNMSGTCNSECSFSGLIS
jgi:hypothetical protein